LINKLHISNVMKKFNFLTNISIIAFDLKGVPIGASGYGKSLYDFLDKNNIYNTMIKNYFNNGENIFNSNCNNNIEYILSPICSRNIHRGVFIIGPISQKKNNCISAPYKPRYLYSYILKSLRLIFKDFPKKHIEMEKEKEYSLHIKKAIDYIDSRYMDNIGLDEVANYLNINRSYFSTIFKVETGESFTNFLNRLRVEKSKKLLINKDYSMLNIALTVGFNNQNYYNIVFKKFTNYTPLQYRKVYAV